MIHPSEPYFKRLRYLKLKSVPTNISASVININHEHKYITKYSGVVIAYFKVLKLEINETRLLAKVTPKAMGNNHFLKRYSFFKVNKNISKKTGVISGVRDKSREFTV